MALQAMFVGSLKWFSKFKSDHGVTFSPVVPICVPGSTTSPASAWAVAQCSDMEAGLALHRYSGERSRASSQSWLDCSSPRLLEPQRPTSL